MFGYRSNIREEDLTPEEATNIKNYFTFAAKRLASGAISSRAFHNEIRRGKTRRAIDEWVPEDNIGHDGIHAMFAYSRTGGRSLVPAYMHVEEVEHYPGEGLNDAAMLEEAYVEGFSGPQDLKEIFMDLRDHGYGEEELATAVVDIWVEKHAVDHNFTYSDPDFPKRERLPEFVNFVRNFVLSLQQGLYDPKFQVHEFQRILAPLLERLRNTVH